MELKEIISITGRPGLFKVVVQGKNNVIVESIVDKKRFPAYASDRISTLGDISIYTTDEDANILRDLMVMSDKLPNGVAIRYKPASIYSLFNN